MFHHLIDSTSCCTSGWKCYSCIEKVLTKKIAVKILFSVMSITSMRIESLDVFGQSCIPVQEQCLACMRH